MFGFLTGEILNGPRVLFASARDKVLPIKPLERIHPKFKTPYIAILTYVSIGFLIATFSGFGQLIEIASATILLIYLGVVFSVIKLRLKRTPEEGEFKIPGGFTVPILSAIAILYIMSNLEMNKKIGMIIFIGVISIIYIGIQYFKRKKHD
jgi:amino acid transporter